MHSRKIDWCFALTISILLVSLIETSEQITREADYLSKSVTGDWWHRTNQFLVHLDDFADFCQFENIKSKMPIEKMPIENV